jgi:hypothetical protein
MPLENLFTVRTHPLGLGTVGGKPCFEPGLRGEGGAYTCRPFHSALVLGPTNIQFLICWLGEERYLRSPRRLFLADFVREFGSEGVDRLLYEAWCGV